MQCFSFFEFRMHFILLSWAWNHACNFSNLDSCGFLCTELFYLRFYWIFFCERCPIMNIWENVSLLLYNHIPASCKPTSWLFRAGPKFRKLGGMTPASIAISMSLHIQMSSLMVSAKMPEFWREHVWFNSSTWKCPFWTFLAQMWAGPQKDGILKGTFLIHFFYLKMLILNILGPDVSWTPKEGILKGTFNFDFIFPLTRTCWS